MALYMNRVKTPPTPSIVSHYCNVISSTRLSINTFEIELHAPRGTVLHYQAGQYLQLALNLKGDGQLQSLSYSIANSFNPEKPERLQLFIQTGGETADKVLKHLLEQRERSRPIKVVMAKGLAFLQTNLNVPHLLIAAGSGISKIKCLTEEILKQRPDANVDIYWSNKNIDDFYLLDEFQSWVDKNENLGFIPVLEASNTEWSGRSGYLYEVIEEDFDDLDGTQAYLCGSPQMVYGTIDKLKASRLKEHNCYSDVFEYAPRDQKEAI